MTRQVNQRKTRYDNGMERTPVVLITGTPGSGKSRTAAELASRFERSAHVQIDFFRKMVRAGYVSPQQWSDEVERQYALARISGAFTARTYAAAGFTVIIDDIIRQHWVDEWRSNLAGFPLMFVLLQPRLDIALDRNRTRPEWQVDEAVIASLHTLLGAENRPDRGWFVVDNSELTIAETADQIYRYVVEHSEPDNVAAESIERGR